MTTYVGGPYYGLENFAFRQFDDKTYCGSQIPFDKKLFIQKINDLHAEKQLQLVPGYADFCKHIFLPNFTKAVPGALPITDENKSCLECGYQKRRDNELAVLSRWFALSEAQVAELKPAKYLDLILYSRAQLRGQRP
eukprot:Platyproteum_vivax@DN12891_c0_g1_i1.p1